MKITTILGSPRKRGNTAAVLRRFENLVPTPHQVERINITDYTVKGCLGCDMCQKKLDEPGCAQKDDAVAILNRLIASDVVVYATPLYVWDFSAQMKALLDRHYCLVKWKEKGSPSLLEGRRVALLVTCGSSVENNADVIQVVFDREADYAGCTVVGKFIVPNCTTPSELGDKVERTARAMFKGIVGD
jgi:multimeric flavodoxin WrbA